MRHLHHPWRVLRSLPDWTVIFADLPDGMLGATDHQRKVIYLDRGMTQAQRRATLAHELQHVHRGPVSAALVEQDEQDVDHAASRELIPIESLVSAVKWCHHGDLDELADELWVDRDTVETRLRNLHPAERHAITRAVEARSLNACQ